jgi:hypothetical protein
MDTVRPIVHTCGDAIGVVFDGEDDAVVFVPNAGDVLISQRGQWEQLVAAAAVPSDSAVFDGGELGLRSTLLHLGVKID